MGHHLSLQVNIQSEILRRIVMADLYPGFPLLIQPTHSLLDAVNACSSHQQSWPLRNDDQQ